VHKALGLIFSRREGGREEREEGLMEGRKTGKKDQGREGEG
jgi:hypothetical protein